MYKDVFLVQVCVSSVDPAAFPAAVEAGALMVRLQTNPFRTIHFRPRIWLCDLVPFEGMLNRFRTILLCAFQFVLI